MRLGILSVCAILCATAVTAAVPEKGIYSGQLRKMLTETAAGTCPADIMGAELLKACHEQMPKIGPELKAAGPIQSLTFVKAEQVKGDRLETYRVAFAKAKPATWYIGSLHGGKFNTTYSPDD